MFSQIKAHIFISPGNHDFYSLRSPYAFMDLPENVHVFRSPSIKCVELPELGCRVWGAGFTSPVCDSILSGFSVGKSNLIDIMTLHGEIGGDRYNGISENDIAATGLDYLALGHVHSFSGIKKAGTTHYAYPGCLEGRGFDETGPKGVICGTVGKEKCDLRFVPVAKRQYQIVDVSLTGCESAEDAVISSIADVEAQNIVRIVLKGEFSGEINTEKLAETLSSKFFSVSVKDETIPTRDVWEGADNDSLTGLFLSRMKEKYNLAQTDEERSACLLAARYGIAALENREAWRP
jgi:DNA repair exonuclease SbcCD nuclease subunit